MAILSGNVFNVKDLSPALWLDAADSSTLYDAVSGGNLVADGGAVARWEDKSGNGRHVTQSTLTNRPVRIANVQGGKDIVRFDGVNDLLSTAANSPSVTGVTIFFVSKHNSFGGSNFARLLEMGSNGYIYMVNLNNAFSQQSYRGLYIAGSLLKDSASFSATTGVWRVHGISNANNSLVSQTVHRVNGVVSSGVITGDGTLTIPANVAMHIGNRSSFDRAFDGDIAEILVFPTVLTDAQNIAVERYLAQKWGLGFNPLSLSPALWLDASDSSTLFDATSGGNLVTAGGAVARWEDKSGNGRHITQSTLDNRPIRSVSSLGGRDTLFFDGVNDFMSSISLPASQVVHWFGVFVPQSKNAYHNIYDGSPMLWLQGSNRLEMNAAYTIGLNVSPAAYINQSIICSIRSSWAIAPGSRMRVNGTIVAQNPALVGSFNVTRNISMFNRSNSQTFSGNFAEQLWFTTDLSNADVIAIERYLAQKWNITN